MSRMIERQMNWFVWCMQTQRCLYYACRFLSSKLSTNTRTKGCKTFSVLVLFRIIILEINRSTHCNQNSCMQSAQSVSGIYTITNEMTKGTHKHRLAKSTVTLIGEQIEQPTNKTQMNMKNRRED